MSTQATEDMDYLERVDYYRENAPDDLEETFTHLLDQGCAPRIAAATIHYVDCLLRNDPITQADITERYDLATITLRKWAYEAWEDHTGEEWDPSLARKTVPDRPIISRTVFHTLYHAESPFLTTAKIANQAGYTHNTTVKALRDLSKSGVVGSRVQPGAVGWATEWWAVPRSDTPEHHDPMEADQ